MGTVQILDTTTRNPISLIGERAGVCWGANITDAAKNYKRGMDCIESGHGRTLEFVNVEMVLDGYSARVMREWYTHIGGAPTRLQASTRYIDYGQFDYIIPASIAKDEQAKRLYKETMWQIREAVMALEGHELPREDIAMLLPLGMTTRVVDKRNLRNLIDMSRQRMCNRAYWEFRNLFRDICIALTNYSEEWGKIVNTQFHSKCAETQTCTEKRGCGKYPGREG
jgi:thymidylate synthase (FAD)